MNSIKKRLRSCSNYNKYKLTLYRNGTFYDVRLYKKYKSRWKPRKTFLTDDKGKAEEKYSQYASLINSASNVLA